MAKRTFEDVAYDLRGIAATLSIISTAFLNDDLDISNELAADSLEGLSGQVERLSAELAEMALPKKNWLRELRTERNMTLEELEKETDIPSAVLQRIENGEEVSLKTFGIAKLAEALNVQPSKLFVA